MGPRIREDTGWWWKWALTGNEILRLRCAALRACEEIPPRRQFEHGFKAKLSLKSGVLRINSQALRMTLGGKRGGGRLALWFGGVFVA